MVSIVLEGVHSELQSSDVRACEHAAGAQWLLHYAQSSRRLSDGHCRLDGGHILTWKPKARGSGATPGHTVDSRRTCVEKNAMGSWRLPMPHCSRQTSNFSWGVGVWVTGTGCIFRSVHLKEKESKAPPALVHIKLRAQLCRDVASPTQRKRSGHQWAQSASALW